MESIILLGVLLFLILLGAPIGFILILIPFVYILFTDAVPLILIPSQMFNAIDSVPLTAIAFFMLTGELMTSATITDRLVALSKSLIGRVRGGLAQVNVLVSMFFDISITILLNMLNHVFGKCSDPGLCVAIPSHDVY